ncbi:MAG: hypothetical protein WD009_02435 [Phycisphaeraceae bacterium]
MLTAERDPATWQQWRAAARQPAVDVELRALYAELDAAVAARGPTCWISGRCCKFAEFGHRLFVTGLEIAWFLHHAPATPATTPATPNSSDAQNPKSEIPPAPLPILGDNIEACPYQIGGLCSTHTTRPMGCRIFFCQHGTEQWQQELYEQYLARLRDLHDTHALPYRYMDWLHGLHAAAAASDPVGRPCQCHPPPDR